jgi:MFS family permease
MVAVAAIARFSSGPSQSYVFSIFIDPVIAHTGLSRTAISSVYTVGTLVGAGVVVVVSRLADRLGVRIMLAVVAFVVGALCGGLAVATGVVAVVVLFAALRAAGQGPLPLLGTLLTVQWFSRRRGLAVALAGFGGTASNAFLPPLAQALNDTLGWQRAYLLLGVLVWVTVIPVALLLVRNFPEDLGLHPDGADRPPAREVLASADTPSRPRRVLTSPAFWLLAIPLSASSFVSTALVFHQVSIFAERGLGAAVAAATFAPYSLAATGTTLLAGLLVGRVATRWLLLAPQGLLLLSLVALLLTATTAGAIVYGLLLGAGSGLQMVLGGVVWAEYYGRRGLGQVQGAASMVSIVASAVAPLPLAALQQAFAGYGPGLAIFAAVPAVCALIVLLWHPRGTSEAQG